MKISKFFTYGSLSCLLLLFSFNCGSDPAAEGEKAYQAANYNLAIKHFVEAKKANPEQKSQFDEKIALSYMLRGQKLYDRTKNVKSFSGNFEKALDFLPDEPTLEFSTEYSKILLAIAQAFMNTKPENEIQKEEYLNKSINYLEDALVNDANNTEASELLDKIKADNFQKMLNKGKEFYTRAGRTKNNDYYINAEYYFKKAAYFDIHNEEASTLLSKTRKKTISILDNREDFAMAIADMNRMKENCILDLTIKNYSTNPVDLALNKFEIVDKNGNSYSVNEKMMNEKFKDKKLSNQKLGELKLAEGYIIFSIPKNVNIEYLGYTLNDEETIKKYFP
jgi:hypothetical protein